MRNLRFCERYSMARRMTSDLSGEALRLLYHQYFRPGKYPPPQDDDVAREFLSMALAYRTCKKLGETVPAYVYVDLCNHGLRPAMGMQDV